MSRNVTITLIVATACGLYFLGIIVTQIIFGLLPSSEIVTALGASGFSSLVISVIVYLVIWFGGKKLGTPDAPMSLGLVGKTIVVAIAIAALAGGVSTSLSRVQDAKELKARSVKLQESATAAREAEATRQASITPEQRAAENAKREARAKESAKKVAIEKAAKEAKIAAEVAMTISRQRAFFGAKALKESMKDPETFEIKEVLSMPDGTACYTYRAKNSFNAMLQGQAVLTGNPKNIELLVDGHDDTKFVNAWNKGCVGKAGIVITSEIKRRLD